MAWILPLCDFGKVSCQDSTESMPVGRIRAFRSIQCPFGSILDMLFLRSNMHQNLWNSLDIMVVAWLWPLFYEIRRSVGGENQRYWPSTYPHSQTLLAPSNKVEKSEAWFHEQKECIRFISKLSSYLGFHVANTFTFEYWSPEQLDGEHDSLPFSVLGGFARFSK